MKIRFCPLVVLVLTGCVRYHARPLSPDAAAQAFAARTLEDDGLRRFVAAAQRQQVTQWPPVTWGLSELTLAAFYYSPDLDVARAQWAVARAATQTAGERPNPTLSLGPGANATTRAPTGWIALVGLDIPIETAGKRGHRRAQAGHLAEAARQAVATMAWQVRGRVRSGLVALFAAREGLAQNAQLAERGAENARILERQFQAGAISAFERTQARIIADNAQLAGEDAKRLEAESRLTLAEAVGVPASALCAVTVSFDGLALSPEPPTLEKARSTALLGRADVLAALEEYAASQSALQLEIARQYPDIHLGPGYEYDQGDSKWSLGLAFDLPVFHRNGGAIAEATAKRGEAAARFTALQARIVADVDRSLAGYRAAIEKQSVAEAMLGRIEKQEARARAMLAVGEISRSELLGLQVELSAQALARLDAVTKSLQALGALEEALQTTLGVPETTWLESTRVQRSGMGGEQP